MGNVRRAGVVAVALPVLLASACSSRPSASDRAADVLTSTYRPAGWVAMIGAEDGADDTNAHVRDVNGVPVLFRDHGDGHHDEVVTVRYDRHVHGDASAADVRSLCEGAGTWFDWIDAGLSSGAADPQEIVRACVAFAESTGGEGGILSTGAHDDDTGQGKYTWGASTRRGPAGDTEVSLSVTYDPTGGSLGA
ncbi:hypothetical protein [Cellulomonas alba]|uniref:Lipoprotein n=1 Tax=Cellulomonas alba TaxID=3053467 RepID=A0ABT7SG40_9CELL|nr:hypothetical protein [Cellulomonas alba]MDM7855163.1 hypothetical protein [Cellulomonas alba]